MRAARTAVRTQRRNWPATAPTIHVITFNMDAMLAHRAQLIKMPRLDAYVQRTLQRPQKPRKPCSDIEGSFLGRFQYIVVGLAFALNLR